MNDSGNFSAAELILALVINMAFSVAIGVLLALLCRWLHKKFPGCWPAMKLLPWRSVTILAMLAFTPTVLMALLTNVNDGFWHQIIRQLLPHSDSFLQQLEHVSSVFQLSFLATAWAGAFLVRLWISASSLSAALSALRSFAVLAIGLNISVQMATGNNTGLGGSLYQSIMMYDLAATSEALKLIVWSVIAIDLFFGAIQFIANWLNERRKMPLVNSPPTQ